MRGRARSPARGRRALEGGHHPRVERGPPLLLGGAESVGTYSRARQGVVRSLQGHLEAKGGSSEKGRGEPQAATLDSRGGAAPPKGDPLGRGPLASPTAALGGGGGSGEGAAALGLTSGTPLPDTVLSEGQRHPSCVGTEETGSVRPAEGGRAKGQPGLASGTVHHPLLSVPTAATLVLAWTLSLAITPSLCHPCLHSGCRPGKCNLRTHTWQNTHPSCGSLLLKTSSSLCGP